MKTVRLLITGKVQGVWYRASTKEKAQSLGLNGQVWNASDGSVCALVQGSDEAVSVLIEWCKEGPQLARVDDVIVAEEKSDRIFSSFEITKGDI